ncbi:MAG: alpha/beta hydrolase [Verrucomicrobiota bacterium]|nr:alpha/beta hydrolase [Verrucomicrobiota bacterium]
MNLRLLVLALIAATAAAQQPAAPRAGQRTPPVPASVEAKKDLPYAGTDNPRQTLDLYLPKQRAGDRPLPVIVFIHGGGWRGGNKAGGGGKLIPYVASGEYAAVSAGYRLSGEAPWPAQIFDCKAAIRWIRGNAKQYGLDPQRIAVWGTSAGGHLVSLLGTSGDVKELEGDLGAHTGDSSRVTCVVNYYGPQNFFTMVRPDGGSGNAASAVTGLFGGPVKEKADAAKAASPVTHVTSDDPPFLTAHGTKDPTVPYGQALEIDAALKKAGVASSLIEMTGGGHGFRSDKLDARVKQFLDLHLRGVKAEIATDPIPVESGG